MNKTHWRACDKTDFLGAADLEEMLEGESKFYPTIIEKVEIKEAKVRGVKGIYRIATFKEKSLKPMIINVGNGKLLRKFSGGSKYIEDWSNIPVNLFVLDNVKIGSETTDAVRIHTVQPAQQKPTLTPGHPKWIDAKTAIEAQNTTIAKIKEFYILNTQNEKLLCENLKSEPAQPIK